MFLKLRGPEAPAHFALVSPRVFEAPRTRGAGPLCVREVAVGEVGRAQAKVVRRRVATSARCSRASYSSPLLLSWSHNPPGVTPEPIVSIFAVRIRRRIRTKSVLLSQWSLSASVSLTTTLAPRTLTSHLRTRRAVPAPNHGTTRACSSAQRAGRRVPHARGRNCSALQRGAWWHRLKKSGPGARGGR